MNACDNINDMKIIMNMFNDLSFLILWWMRKLKVEIN